MSCRRLPTVRPPGAQPGIAIAGPFMDHTSIRVRATFRLLMVVNIFVVEQKKRTETFRRLPGNPDLWIPRRMIEVALVRSGY